MGGPQECWPAVEHPAVADAMRCPALLVRPPESTEVDERGSLQLSAAPSKKKKQKQKHKQTDVSADRPDSPFLDEGAAAQADAAQAPDEVPPIVAPRAASHTLDDFVVRHAIQQVLAIAGQGLQEGWLPRHAHDAALAQSVRGERLF